MWYRRIQEASLILQGWYKTLQEVSEVLSRRDGIRGYGRISGTAGWYTCQQEGPWGQWGWSERLCEVSLALPERYKRVVDCGGASATTAVA